MVVALPGKFVSATDVQQFEGAAGAVAGGDVAGRSQRFSTGALRRRMMGNGEGGGRAEYLHVDDFAGDNQAIVSNEGFPGCADSLLAVGCEGELSGAGVAAVEGPFCLAMPDYEGAGGCHCQLEAERAWVMLAGGGEMGV